MTGTVLGLPDLLHTRLLRGMDPEPDMLVLARRAADAGGVTV